MATLSLRPIPASLRALVVLATNCCKPRKSIETLEGAEMAMSSPEPALSKSVSFMGLSKLNAY